MRDIVGTTITGRYRVVEQIGEGGMSRVYKVGDNDMSVYLAIKILRDDLTKDKIFLRRFMREAESLQKL